MGAAQRLLILAATSGDARRITDGAAVGTTMAEHITRNSTHSPGTALERAPLAPVNGAPSLMFGKDVAFRDLIVNLRFAEYGPQSVDTMVGLTDHDILPGDGAAERRLADRTDATLLDGVRCTRFGRPP